jgi:cytochrome c5
MQFKCIYAVGVVVFALFAGAAISDPLTAHGEAGKALQASAPARDTPEAELKQMICRNRMATGSRLSYARDCHTRAEWDVIHREAREYVNNQQLKGFNAGKPCGKTC